MIFGIDVGFSPTEETSCYCAFNIDQINKNIFFLHKPVKFKTGFNFYPIITTETEIITIDAPLSPKLIPARPGSGRIIEKLFSNGIFNNSQRGPQPSSIAVPRQGWPLYQAGMKMVSSISSLQYLSISDIQNGTRKGIYEVIPKLTQSLLAPREVVVSRNKNCKLDDYLFPLLFASNGKYKNNINSMLGDYRFHNDVQDYIDKIATNPKRFHEELASIICAVQGVFFYLGKAFFVGFKGDHEGYYTLPSMDCWNLEWQNCFMDLIVNKFADTIVL